MFSPGSSDECNVSAMGAREGREAAQGRLQARRAKKGRVLLRLRPQRAERECDGGTGVAGMEFLDRGHEPNWCVACVHEQRRGDVASVGWMLQKVF
eukprot:50338-Pleurochrysis_carterae.AAC.3